MDEEQMQDLYPDSYGVRSKEECLQIFEVE